MLLWSQLSTENRDGKSELFRIASDGQNKNKKTSKK